MLRRWWERWPGRLEFELEALKAAGIRVDSQQTDGYRLVFELIAQVNNLEVRLIARFPDLYPYTRFEVFAPDLELQRHQNPHLKNLCLVPLGDYWEIDATLADFISKQLPRVFTAATSEELDKVAELEIHQGEPVSHYYFYVPNAIIVVSSEWDLKNTVGGELTIEGYFDSTGLIRASVAELTSLSGEILARQQVVPSWEGRV